MRRILFVDDDVEILRQFEEDFKKNNIEVITCINSEEANNAVENDIPFDVVILDWFFEDPDDSILSRTFLNKLNNKHFRPVFVFTNRLSDYENTPDDAIHFPRNLLKGFSKDIGYETLKVEIEQLLKRNISLQLASAYRNKIYKILEKVFFELNDLPNADISMVLKKVVGIGENIDWSSDLILNLIHRSLLSDDEFVIFLKRIIEQAGNINEGISETERKKIANKVLYFKSKSNYIRNGDIIKIKNIEEDIIFYGIIVTPDCDLEQSYSQYIEITELCLIDDPKLGLNTRQKDNIRQFKPSPFHFFPSIGIGDELKDFVAVIKSKIIVRELPQQYHPKYPNASKRLLYSDRFILNDKGVKLEMICSKCNPYKAEFLQKLHSNNSRVGIPNINDLVI
ncbi:MAG: hypothetical protein IT280_03460 [Ignavibacteria bacterium]|nr:hypothetical protein [Ignavibacteria bacterium]